MQVFGITPWITLNGLDVAGTNFIFRHLAKAATSGGGDLELTLGPAERAVSSAMRVMLEESFDRCLRLDRFVYNRPSDQEGNIGCLSDFWKRRSERNSAVAHGIGRMRRADVEAAGLECLRSIHTRACL